MRRIEIPEVDAALYRWTAEMAKARELGIADPREAAQVAVMTMAKDDRVVLAAYADGILKNYRERLALAPNAPLSAEQGGDLLTALTVCQALRDAAEYKIAVTMDELARRGIPAEDFMQSAYRAAMGGGLNYAAFVGKIASVTGLPGTGREAPAKPAGNREQRRKEKRRGR